MTRARDFASVICGNFAIPAGSLGNAVPADGSITTAKLADDAITSAKIADDAVTSAAIATNAVASDALNITSADLPSGTVLQCKTTNYPNDFLFSLNASGVPADNGYCNRLEMQVLHLLQQIAKYSTKLLFIWVVTMHMILVFML